MLKNTKKEGLFFDRARDNLDNINKHIIKKTIWNTNSSPIQEKVVVADERNFDLFLYEIYNLPIDMYRYIYNIFRVFLYFCCVV